MADTTTNTLPATIMPKAESPLFDSSKGLEEKQRARDEAASLMDRNAQGLSASGMGAYAQQLSEDKVRAAAMGTPGVMQQNAAGFQALYQQPAAKAAMPGASTDAEAAANRQKQMDVQGAANIAAFDKTGAPIQSQGQYDAIKAGVSAYYDPASGKWVNSTTGQPQAGTGEGPGTSKYGSTLNGLIANGFSPYYGLTEGQADAIESQKAQGEAEKYKAVSGMQQKANESEAKSLINAGQAGGFMSTQLSGTAANTAGPTWVGSGGVLARIQNENQQRIAEVDKQMSEAIQAATNAARFAYRTGNAQDVQQAQEASAKVAELQDFRTAQAEDLLKRTKALSEIQKLERGTADETLTNIAKSGMAFESLPAEYAETLDRHYQSMGYPEGYAKSVLDLSKKERAIKDEENEAKKYKAQTEVVGSIIKMANELPVGHSFTIGNATYTGMKKGDIQSGTEKLANGQLVYWQVDKETGQQYTTKLDGVVGAPEDGWANVQTDQGWFSVNSKTNQAVPLEPSSAQTTWQKLFPDGSQSPFRSKDDPYQGQCAAFNNDLYGQKILGNTFSEKKAAFGKYKFDGDVQVGDSFLMTAGDTGHVGIVAGVKKGPDGKDIYTCLESNMVPPGGGVISTTRTMKEGDPRLKAFARIPTPRLPPAGTDSPWTQAAMGNTSAAGRLTIGGKPLSEVLGDMSKPTQDMQEYKFAKDTGYTGSFADWMKKGSGTSSGSSDEAKAWAEALNSGEAKLSEIPADMRGEAIRARKAMAEASKASEYAEFEKAYFDPSRPGPVDYQQITADWEKYQSEKAKEQASSQDPATVARNIFDGTSALSVASLPIGVKTKVDTELAKLKQEAIKAGDTVGELRASAGGKDVSDSFIQAYDKGANVLNQVGELSDMLGKEDTGPILGIVRSNNPYDQKAREIQARLTAIVPNLARGVYGEVGVLTDQDVALYSKTLPNLRDTNAVNKAILSSTIRSVGRSMEQKLKSQAAAGRDVSGYVDSYVRLMAESNRMLAESDPSKFRVVEGALYQKQGDNWVKSK